MCSGGEAALPAARSGGAPSVFAFALDGRQRPFVAVNRFDFTIGHDHGQPVEPGMRAPECGWQLASAQKVKLGTAAMNFVPMC